ncbi:MAG: RDD family protein [Thermoanaerobaculia bacterium]|nr:RDD family protein [Thermoanaerobaculia bacterium]
MRLDTVRSRATPEGINLSLRVAGAPIRSLAWFIDLILISLSVFLLQMVLAFFGTFGIGLLLIFLFSISWFYGVVFEQLNDGTTPGKKILGLRVVHDDGTPVTVTGSLLRNLLRVADFLPMAYGAGLVALFLSKDCQRLGDMAAGTLVVYREDETHRGVPPAEPVVPPVALSRSEQRALVDFAARLPTWGPERAQELASVIQPLTRAQGPRSVERLVGMAQYVLGRRNESSDEVRTVGTSVRLPGGEGAA